MTKDERFALTMARFYRAVGLNPLPSSMEPPKKPLESFTPYPGWERQIPAERFTDEAWEARPTTNLQVMLGRMPWRLLVIDLDGEEGHNIWRSWSRDRWMPRTWVTHREGGHSTHLWFRLPKDYPEPLPAKFLWRGEPGSHQGIERLCDQRMIVAPPSFHVQHKDCQYRFKDDANSPKKLNLPTPCPGWILRLKPVAEEKPKAVFVSQRPAPRRPPVALDRESLPSRDEILDRIHDKIGLAKSWGVRFTGHASPTGWHECHAIDRPDNKPSAAVHKETGIYTDRGSGVSMSLFDLHVAMGQAVSFDDSRADLAERYR